MSLTLVLLVGVTPAAFAARAIYGGVPVDAEEATDDYCPATGGAHSWSDREVINRTATCTEDAAYLVRCGRCGYTTTLVTTPALGHDWSEWFTIEEATCTEPGILGRQCSRCGEVETEYLPVLDHDFILSEVIQEATCTEPGIYRYTCSRCGTTLDEETPLAPHSFGEWNILTEATPWSSGVREHVCALCGATEQTEYYLEGTLFPSEQGDAVAAFQVLLNQNGFDCGEPDGSFGPMTQAATEAAEQAAGHDPTGIGWTGLQAWLAGDTLAAESIDNGDLALNESQSFESAAGLLAQLRIRRPNNNENGGLTIAVQPVGGRLSDVLGYRVLSITMADGTGSMTYWLYRDGELYGSPIEKSGDDPDRLYCEIKIRHQGEYYFHVEDSTGRWADSDLVTGTVMVSYDEPLIIKEQPKDGALSKDTGKYTLSITMADDVATISSMEYCLYKDDELYSSYEKYMDDPDKLHYETTVDQPGEYYFYVKEFTGRRALSNTVTVTGQNSSEYPEDSARWSHSDEDGGLTIAVQPVGGRLSEVLGYYKLSITMADGTGPMKYWVYYDGKLYYGPTEKSSDDPDRLYYEWEARHPGEYYFHVEDSTGRWADSNAVIVTLPWFEDDEPLIIEEQPKGGALSAVTGKYMLGITIANSTMTYSNSLVYYLYDKDGNLYDSTKKTEDDPNPLHAEITVDKPGEYCFYVAESSGRRALSNTVTVTESQFKTLPESPDLPPFKPHKPLIVAQHPTDGLLPDGSSGSALVLTAQVEGGVAPYTFEWRRVEDWALSQKIKPLERLDTISPIIIAEQFVKQASSVKSKMEEAFIYTGMVRNRQEELVEQDVASQITRVVAEINSQVVTNSISYGNSSTYYATEPGTYFCIITDSKGTWVTTDSAYVDYGK
ncbi:MAG: hypothetical protein IKE43_02980 [Coriobacteriales bacterium]|nr:hypothetical protein [Coriobacteriales bacterium]